MRNGFEGARPAREMTLAPRAIDADVSNLAKTGTKCIGHESGFKVGVGIAGRLRRQSDLRQCRPPSERWVLDRGITIGSQPMTSIDDVSREASYTAPHRSDPAMS